PGARHRPAPRPPRRAHPARRGPARPGLGVRARRRGGADDAARADPGSPARGQAPRRDRPTAGVRGDDWSAATVRRSAMSTWDVLLWGAAPYVTIAVLVVGSLWRWRYDRFGWTTRSSQLYESRLLRLASPLFHFGLLVVIVGHVVGLLVPAA